MCRHTCTTCRADMNQREAETHECPPKSEAYMPAPEAVEAAAQVIALTVSFDADPDLTGYRILARDALIAAHETTQ